jgi:cytochrome c-type biogenesis protein CcmH/NrfF
MVFWLWLFFLQAWAENEIGLNEPPLLDPPPLEQVEERSYSLGKILRCPVCQGLSVADSRSDAAVAMKNRIKELIALGYSDEQIIDYFVGRYGEFALLKPKYEHWFVWVAPGILGLLGVAIVAVRVRKQQPKGKTIIHTEDVTSDDNKYRQQILAELEEE